MGKKERRFGKLALTRRSLKAMGIDEEKIDEIIAMHTETTSGLKEEAAKYKEDAEKLTQTAKDLEKAQEDLEAEKKSGWKEKYDSLKTEYENYKTEQANKEAHSAKEAAYRELLKEAGVSEKRIAAILKISDIDGIELDDAGAVKDSGKLTESIKSEWADFIVSQETKGAETANPPANNPPAGQRTSRAAQIAADYHKSLYGTNGKETK